MAGKRKEQRVHRRGLDSRAADAKHAAGPHAFDCRFCPERARWPVDAPSTPSDPRDVGAALSPPKPGEAPSPGHALKPPERPAEQPTQTKVPSFTMSAAKAPSLSLPKGGGAIQPLGETFKTNPSTGTGSYSVPLGMPDARGFSPGLALQYDSGSGNGLFGLGWSPSLGAVTLHQQKAARIQRQGRERHPRGGPAPKSSCPPASW